MLHTLHLVVEKLVPYLNRPIRESVSKASKKARRAEKIFSPKRFQQAAVACLQTISRWMTSNIVLGHVNDPSHITPMLKAGFQSHSRV